jgi:methylamine dehydrogenase heavy chain
MRKIFGLLGVGALVGALVGLATPAGAELPVDRPGRVATLPQPAHAHWIWVTDLLLGRIGLVDLDDGRMLGMLSGGYRPTQAVFPRQRSEIYVPETFYARGTRGERTDVVTIYDGATLEVSGEVVIPPKRASNALPTANSALSDDERFLAVFNMTPATSLSIVDLAQRRFVEEIPTPGCSLVYAAGERRFLMLCADGAALTVTLDADGRLAGRTRSEPFFDPETDPVTEKAVRRGNQWIFVSFAGVVHAVDVSGETLRFAEPWSLVDERDRADSWRIGGSQHLAVHEASGRLYSLMHQGGPNSHKEPASELWIYDLDARERLQRVALSNPGITYMGEPLAFGDDWIWPFNRLYAGILSLLPPLIDGISVTHDPEPLLVAASAFSTSLAVYDGLSLDLLRRLPIGGLTVQTLQTPFAEDTTR